MSIRLLLGVLLVGALIASLVFIAGSVVFVREQVALLFPPDVALETNQALHMLLLQQAIGLLLTGVLLSIALFWALSMMVIKPLRSIISAMEAYMTTGVRAPLADTENAPKEIKSLGEVFKQFRDKVETAHRIDTETARVKSDFISTAAHQLRTPLTGIRWALEALEKENLTENQIALVKSAREKSHDLVDVVGTLLDISSIESGKFNYKFAPLDLQKLVASIATDFGEMAVRQQVSLFYAKDDAELPKVRADESRIKWILNNLIENAVQYTPPGGTVRVSTDAGSGRVFVRVRDTGIGIPDADRANIFERFYRGSNAKEKENKGNGLGLYIARTIATDHGGDLHFEPNENGPGTTFVLSLPVVG
jgi:signal transduction histidine kinase